MNKPFTPEITITWKELLKETKQTADQFRQIVLSEVKSKSIQLGIPLTEQEILESGFLSPHLPPEIRSVIVQCRKVLDAFAALERIFPEEEEQH